MATRNSRSSLSETVPPTQSQSSDNAQTEARPPEADVPQVASVSPDTVETYFDAIKHRLPPKRLNELRELTNDLSGAIMKSIIYDEAPGDDLMTKLAGLEPKIRAEVAGISGGIVERTIGGRTTWVDQLTS